MLEPTVIYKHTSHLVMFGVVGHRSHLKSSDEQRVNESVDILDSYVCRVRQRLIRTAHWRRDIILQL